MIPQLYKMFGILILKINLSARVAVAFRNGQRGQSILCQWAVNYYTWRHRIDVFLIQRIFDGISIFSTQVAFVAFPFLVSPFPFLVLHFSLFMHFPFLCFQGRRNFGSNKSTSKFCLVCYGGLSKSPILKNDQMPIFDFQLHVHGARDSDCAP